MFFSAKDNSPQVNPVAITDFDFNRRTPFVRLEDDSKVQITRFKSASLESPVKFCLLHTRDEKVISANSLKDEEINDEAMFIVALPNHHVVLIDRGSKGQIWDLKTAQQVKTFDSPFRLEHSSSLPCPRGICLDGKNKILLGQSFNKTATFASCDLTDPQHPCISTFKIANVTRGFLSFACSENSILLGFVGGKDNPGEIHIYDRSQLNKNPRILKTNTQISKMEIRDHYLFVHGFYYPSDVEATNIKLQHFQIWDINNLDSITLKEEIEHPTSKSFFQEFLVRPDFQIESEVGDTFNPQFVKSLVSERLTETQAIPVKELREMVLSYLFSPLSSNSTQEDNNQTCTLKFK